MIRDVFSNDFFVVMIELMVKENFKHKLKKFNIMKNHDIIRL